MRKFLSILTMGVLTSSALSAMWCEGIFTQNDCCNDNNWPSPVNLEANGGFRRDKFRWSIAGPMLDDSSSDEEIFEPPVLSELQWKDLRIIQFGGSASYVSCTNYALKISGDYGHIYHGRNIDTDFDENENVFLRSENDAGKGCVYDVEGAVGYRVTSTGGRFIGVPLIGYSYHGQQLHMFEGDLVINRFPPPFNGTGRFDGLNSTYKTRWFGPWIGLDFVTRVEKCAYVFGGFEWHLVSYRATGNWNLREDISEFHHRAHGFGYVVTAGGNWEIWKNWSIGVKANFRNFRTRHGRERTTVFIDDSGTIIPIEVEGRFNGARWKSVDVSAMIAWRF